MRSLPILLVLFLATTHQEALADDASQLTTEGGIYPTWSPDGSQIAFERQGYIMAVPATGGTVTTLMYPWGPCGAMFGGAVTSHEPTWSPDGDRIAFVWYQMCGEDWFCCPGIYVIPAEGVPEGGEEPDAIELVSGDARFSWPAWATGGGLVAFSYINHGERGIFVRSMTGGERTRLTWEQSDASPTWSPDDSQIAFDSEERSGNRDIWVMLATGEPPPAQQLTTHAGVDEDPAWNGDQIAFASDRSGNLDIWVMPATGGAPIQVTDDPADDMHPTWSPDGAQIAFTRDRNIWVIDVDLVLVETTTWGAIKAHYREPPASLGRKPEPMRRPYHGG